MPKGQLTQRGRPPKRSASLTRDAIVTTALRLLEERAGRQLSLRSVAAVLGVTPMALYPHIGDFNGLLDAMAEHCFAGNFAQEVWCEARGLQAHLLWYCERVLQYPGLTAAIVARQGTLPAPQLAWTNSLSNFILNEGLNIYWRDVFVDHLHGFALSSAAAAMNRNEAIAMYALHLDLLLKASGIVKS